MADPITALEPDIVAGVAIASLLPLGSILNIGYGYGMRARIKPHDHSIYSLGQYTRWGNGLQTILRRPRPQQGK